MRKTCTMFCVGGMMILSLKFCNVVPLCCRSFRITSISYSDNISAALKFQINVLINNNAYLPCQMFWHNIPKSFQFNLRPHSKKYYISFYI